MHYQKKKLTRTAVAVLMILCAACVSAQAEDAAATKEDTAKTTNTPPLKVVHKLSPITVIEQREQNGERLLASPELQMLPSSTGTVTDSLRGLSSVQFDPSSRSGATGGEITPPAISIRGSRYWENSFTINGFSNNSSFGDGAWDPSGSVANAASYQLPLTGDAQSIILPTDILESVSVLSENISAQHGGFTGGVVDAKIRDAQMDRWHIKTNIKHTSDKLTKLHWTPTQDKNDKPISTDRLQKEFKRYSGGLTIDGPLADGRLGLLMSYQKDWSSMPVWTKYTGDPEKFERHNQKRNIDNFIVKLNTLESNPFYISGAVIYSPYTASMYVNNRKNGDFSFVGGGWQFLVNSRLNTNIGKWTNDFGLGLTEVSYKPGTNTEYQWAKSESANWSSSKTQIEGLTSNSKQNEQNWSYKSGFEFVPLNIKDVTHLVKTGIDFNYVNANRKFGSGKSYSTGTINSSVIGSKEEGVLAGEQYARELQIFKEGELSSHYLTLSGYFEDSILWDRFTFRPGLRITYDDISKETNYAPRLFGNIDLLNDKRFNLNAGYNRYYGNQLLSYALLAKQGSTLFRRGIGSDNKPTDWRVGKSTDLKRAYDLTELTTPYSDEYTLGLSADILNHTIFRVQAVSRDYKDQLRMMGGTNDRKLTNTGFTKYKGLTFGFDKYFDLGKWGKHHSSVDVTRSSKRGNVFDSLYFDDVEMLDWNPNIIMVDGKKISVDDMDASKFNADWVLTYTHESSFLNDRLHSTILARYESPADRLIRLNDYVFDEDRKLIRTYRSDKQKSLFNIDLNLAYDIYKTQQSAITMELQVLNLFDRRNMLMSDGYSMGRQFFLGLSASY